MPVLVWISDWTKAGVYFNRAWLDFTGRTLEEEKGDSWVENVHPEDLIALELCRRAFIERRPFITDFRLRRRDGEYRWMLDAGQPRFASDGSFLGYIGSCIDITERRTVEAALRRSEEKLRVALESAQRTKSDGPPVKAPPERGFGLKLIEQLLVSELGGSARFDYKPAGFQMLAELPLANLAGRTDLNAAADPDAGDG